MSDSPRDKHVKAGYRAVDNRLATIDVGHLRFALSKMDPYSTLELNHASVERIVNAYDDLIISNDRYAVHAQYDKFCIDTLTELLREGIHGFGHVLIATSHDAAVRDWQKRARAALAAVKEDK